MKYIQEKSKPTVLQAAIVFLSSNVTLKVFKKESFRDVTPSCLVQGYRSFGVTYSLMFTSYYENLSSRLLRNVCSSNSSGDLNPLNAELNPICHLLAILGRATIVVVSRLRVKVPSQQKVLFPMVSFLSRSTALF